MKPACGTVESLFGSITILIVLVGCQPYATQVRDSWKKQMRWCVCAGDTLTFRGAGEGTSSRFLTTVCLIRNLNFHVTILISFLSLIGIVLTGTWLTAAYLKFNAVYLKQKGAKILNDFIGYKVF